MHRRNGPASPLSSKNTGFFSTRQRLDEQRRSHWSAGLDLIYGAIKRRNEAVHRPVEVASSWVPYSTGDGGDWVPVITLMCDQEYDEQNLRRDLALQHRATLQGHAAAPVP